MSQFHLTGVVGYQRQAVPLVGKIIRGCASGRTNPHRYDATVVPLAFELHDGVRPEVLGTLTLNLSPELASKYPSGKSFRVRVTIDNEGT